MATTGLYSQHLNNRKVLHLRNTIIAIVLMIATLLVIKAVVAKKHAGIFAEMAEADKVLYNK